MLTFVRFFRVICVLNTYTKSFTDPPLNLTFLALYDYYPLSKYPEFQICELSLASLHNVSYMQL